MKDGIGKNDTREDHPHAASQLFASYAKALEVRGLAAIIGAEELGESDQRFLAFADAFEQRFISQREDEDRSVFETLGLAWELLSMLPPEALTRVTEDELATYHKWQDHKIEAPA
jgi:V/A-type H+-transporting ATPase subunit B